MKEDFKLMKDDLGNRIKENFENRTRYFVPRRTYTILRLDGKSFHTYTKGLIRPFDDGLSEDIDNAIIAMLSEIQGALFVYTQSDEISVLLTDFSTPTTSAWFDGNIQKMSSVAASIMTAEFNKLRLIGWMKGQRYQSTGMPRMYSSAIDIPIAYFDCRTFTIPDRVEVMNYFRWRQQDCIRNSVSMVAQSHFSPKKLHGKSQSDMHEMLHQKGINWATDFSDGNKNGRIIVKETYEVSLTEINQHRHDSEKLIGLDKDGPLKDMVQRTKWVAKGAWVLTKDEGKLLNMIPKISE